MIPRMAVERVSLDQRTRETWYFWFLEDRMTLVLDEYRTEVKETKRHKWRLTEMWERLNDRRDWSLPAYTLLKNKPSIPKDVALEALQRLYSMIRVDGLEETEIVSPEPTT